MAEYADTSDLPPLKELSSRLEAARKDAALEAQTVDQKRGQAIGSGFRLGSELLAAMIVGPLLGLGLDRLAGISPWGLVGGIFVGFAAGVMNVSRAMKEAAAKREADDDN
ncbi:MAG: AtpZ/AtpI family protein [Parvularculaceae bacterium]|nr:AtpZ/AtpI family protein [Parvularculaceae bacterium]